MQLCKLPSFLWLFKEHHVSGWRNPPQSTQRFVVFLQAVEDAPTSQTLVVSISVKKIAMMISEGVNTEEENEEHLILM